MGSPPLPQLPVAVNNFNSYFPAEHPSTITLKRRFPRRHVAINFLRQSFHYTMNQRYKVAMML